MIEVRNISKIFGDKTVLSDVSTCFEQGKVNLIIGRSGSGKTVLMKCIVGLFEPDGGKVFYNGFDFYNLPQGKQRALRAEMGMVFQGAALFDSMTIEENVKFPLDMFTDMTEGEKHKRIDLCLERVDLPGVNRLFPSELSGGMKKRAAVARAIACQPQYLFCDEPNSGLDPKTALMIDQLITEITHEFNITTIINTHDLNSVITIGETIAFINEGQLVWTGDRDNVLVSHNPVLDDFIYAQPLTQKLDTFHKHDNS